MRADDALTIRRVTSPIITLTTDFGSRDGYAAAMKGVILGIHHGATIVDVTHDVPPQDIAHAAFVLGTTCPYFPPDAVHVAVVDPGVATERHPLLLVTPRGSYVAPDNGVVTYILMAEGVLAKPIAAPMAAEAMLAQSRSMSRVAATRICLAGTSTGLIT